MTREEYNERKREIERRFNRLIQEEIKADNLLDELGCDHCYQEGACDSCKHKKLCDAVSAAWAKRTALNTKLGELYKQRMEERKNKA